MRFLFRGYCCGRVNEYVVIEDESGFFFFADVFSGLRSALDGCETGQIGLLVPCVAWRYRFSIGWIEVFDGDG